MTSCRCRRKEEPGDVLRSRRNKRAVPILLEIDLHDQRDCACTFTPDEDVSLRDLAPSPAAGLLVKQVKRQPVERDTLYNVIKEF